MIKQWIYSVKQFETTLRWSLGDGLCNVLSGLSVLKKKKDNGECAAPCKIHYPWERCQLGCSHYPPRKIYTLPSRAAQSADRFEGMPKMALPIVRGAQIDLGGFGAPRTSSGEVLDFSWSSFKPEVAKAMDKSRRGLCIIYLQYCSTFACTQTFWVT